MSLFYLIGKNYSYEYSSRGKMFVCLLYFDVKYLPLFSVKAGKFDLSKMWLLGGSTEERPPSPAENWKKTAPCMQWTLCECQQISGFCDSENKHTQQEHCRRCITNYNSDRPTL